MNDSRADSFLRLIRRSQRGRLKIYLGYAAGVGKTYQMLLEARRLRQEGVEVAVGLVECHGRAETLALTEGLELIPRRRITYRGIEIEEMDLAAILARRPAVVLVDELAHNNVPGSKNAKRYQDVDEILSAGIHVISTLNIQHLESLYETVERATGVRVRERIPDRVVAEADQLVNVDLTTEDLRRRIEEGKVYTQERIETALSHFFRTTNLEQLRELTLRELAAQIDSRQRGPLTDETPSSPDQVMVCISSGGPNTEALLRYASRLAGRLNRNWYAVYVQTSAERPTVVDARTQRQLADTMTLAQQLGAAVFTYRGEDIAKTILLFAREYRVGHIVIGTPGRKLPLWRRMLGEVSIVERLYSESSGMTIVLLDTRAEERKAFREAGEDSGVQVQEKAPAAAGTGEAPKSPLENVPVVIWEESMEKEDAMKELLEVSCESEPAVKDNAWYALLERERQGGTFLGEDVAIPHARIAGISRPLVALGVGKLDIHERETGRNFRLMLLLLSPADNPNIHVATLGRISRMARDDQWRRIVLAAKSPEEVLRIIRSWDV
ncbi:PTS sugar transporter subunit IIA [bacterium]|nr:PTS sugar transporter subunit IIA [bacterium]